MILADIRTYLQQRERASLSDIALHLDSDPDAVRGMLQRWIRKGKVRKYMANAACNSGCNVCDPTATEFYEWLENDGSPMQIPLTTPDNRQN